MSPAAFRPASVVVAGEDMSLTLVISSDSGGDDPLLLLTAPSSSAVTPPAPATTVGMAVEEAPLEAVTGPVPLVKGAPSALGTTVDLEIAMRTLLDNLIVYSRVPRRVEEPTTLATKFIG